MAVLRYDDAPTAAQAAQEHAQAGGEVWAEGVRSLVVRDTRFAPLPGKRCLGRRELGNLQAEPLQA